MGDNRASRGILGSALALLLLVSLGLPATADGEAPVRVPGSERYALKLLNCTRTGGWVTATGRCNGRASGRYSPSRAPLKRSQGISNKVAWPWAGTLTAAQACDHVLPGEPEPAQRMSIKGYGLAAFGENVGCVWGGATPRQVVLSTHLAMQAEKHDGGGHWLNMKSSSYKSVGIGVATRYGRTTVVYDFYGKRAY